MLQCAPPDNFVNKRGNDITNLNIGMYSFLKKGDRMSFLIAQNVAQPFFVKIIT
jgi:hypothetical protein